nr:hypothetical protein [Lederbergia citrea]
MRIFICKSPNQSPSLESQLYGRKISDEQARKIKKLNERGLFIGEDSKRYYPFENNLSHVLGFVGADNQGLMGLELYYDKQLRESKEEYLSILMQRGIKSLL